MSWITQITEWKIPFNSFLSSGDFSRLLITFANSLEPNQVRQNIGPDLDPNRLAFSIVFQEVNFEKKRAANEQWPSKGDVTNIPIIR